MQQYLKVIVLRGDITIACNFLDLYLEDSSLSVLKKKKSLTKVERLTGVTQEQRKRAKAQRVLGVSEDIYIACTARAGVLDWYCYTSKRVLSKQTSV